MTDPHVTAGQAQDQEREQPQIYLITPPRFDLESFGPRLASVLDTTDVACVRISAGGWNEDELKRAADLVRDCAHARDVVCVIETHFRLVEPHGLDGVHLSNGRSVRATRKELGDAIIGAFCGASRHEGMAAGEAGADYIAFGPVTETELGDGRIAERDLFAWWSEMIELPVVAEGGLTLQAVEGLVPVTDFLAFGPEIWAEDDPASALRDLTAPMRG